MVPNAPAATLKFETDFDFDLSNAQFIKEELEREVRNGVHVRGSLFGLFLNKQRFSYVYLFSLSLIMYIQWDRCIISIVLSLLLSFISILSRALIVHLYLQRELLSHQSKRRCVQQQMNSLDQNSTMTRPSPSLTISPLTKSSGKLMVF